MIMLSKSMKGKFLKLTYLLIVKYSGKREKSEISSIFLPYVFKTIFLIQWLPIGAHVNYFPFIYICISEMVRGVLIRKWQYKYIRLHNQSLGPNLLHLLK